MRIAIAGAGLSGATVAHHLNPFYDVTVFESEAHVGGACHTARDPETGVMVHTYGPHIFHTARPEVRDFVEDFGTWMRFDLRMKSMVDDQIYSGPPINLHTINQFFKTRLSPAKAQARVAEPRMEPYANFEEAAISTVGQPLYEAFLQHYTAKQWGRPAAEIPASVFARLPIRFNYDDRKYPRGEWQAIPLLGYTAVIERMLEGITVLLNTPFRRIDAEQFDHVIYTGPIDGWFDYVLGRLEYRTVHFEKLVLPVEDGQGAPCICYPGLFEDFTRITEHKHFAPWERHDHTVLSVEHSDHCGPTDRPFYPVRVAGAAVELIKDYEQLTHTEKNVTFLGRLATYRYIDMEQAVWEAIECARKFM